MAVSKDLFVSYSREDTVKEFVQKLKRDLERAQVSVWLDEEDLPEPLAITIALTALSSCKALIAVLTRNYLSSGFCKSELYFACRHHKPIFPVVCEEGWDAVVVSEECSEGVKYMKAACNWVNFLPSDDYGLALQKLIENVNKQGAAVTPATGPLPIQPQSTPTSTTLGMNERNILNVLHEAGFSDSDWFQLGLQLIETDNLKNIRANHHHVSNCMIDTISQWLKSDVKASWEKLAKAVTKVGGYGEATVKAVRQQAGIAVQNTPDVTDAPENDSTPQDVDAGHGKSSATGTHNRSTVAIARRNIRKIEGKFSMLVTNSQERLQSRINVKKFRIFLITMYSSPNSRDGSSTVTTVIKSTESLGEMFVAFGEYGLWDYLNYYLLQEIIEEFASDDDELNDMMVQYQRDLTGHVLTQKNSNIPGC